MRTAFFRVLCELAEQDERITLVTGDLGFGVVEPFAKRFPERFLNVGVAEQNMTGVAAGMALCGKTVFTYSIANFPTLRCLEQIRNDVCYHKANVKVVAVGGGFSYGALGMTHHATEDLAIMRALPEMMVVAPGDPWETECATRAIANHVSPCYLRLGRAGEPAVHTSRLAFELGKAITVRDGYDLTLVSTGGMLETTLKAAERLAAKDLNARVLSMHTIKPIDADAIEKAVAETGAILTIEEHSVVGGLGGAVAEIVAELRGRTPFRRLGIPPVFVPEVGSQEYLRARCGLSEDAVVDAAISLMRPSGNGGLQGRDSRNYVRRI